MEITLKLANLTQLEAVAMALESHIEMESDRSKEQDFSADDKAHLAAAQKVYAMITGRVRS